MADSLDKGGVFKWISHSFDSLTSLSYPVLILTLILIAVFTTEVLSNLALVTVLIPIMATFAMDNAYPVLQICFAVTLASSFGFMMPIGTPPNAIVFSSGHVTIKQMASVGFLMNIIGALIIFGVCYLLM